MRTLFGLFLALLLTCGSLTAQQFTYPDFLPAWGLIPVGDAAVIGNRIDLSPPFPYGYVGAVWYGSRVTVVNGFTTTATFTVSERSGQMDYFRSRGGDGFAFVIQGFGPAPLGTDGGGLGYDGIPNSVAVEFDTYANEEWAGEIDSSSLSISIHTDGAGVNRADEIFSLARTDRPRVRFDDGRVHTLRITYMDSLLSVYLDDCDVPEVTARLNLAEAIFLPTGQAWIGFSAASASAYERHTLYSWCFTSWSKFANDYCPCTPDPPQDSVVVVGPPDTVRVVDTLRTTDTLRLTDTVERVDTLRTFDTLTIHTVDTLEIVFTDTVIVTRIDTVRIVDTLETILYRDTLTVYDTVYVACYDPYQPFDSLCGGDYRIMEILDRWLRIVSVAPNPASNYATITYDTDDGEAYYLGLYDASGKLAVTIADEPPQPGARVTVTVDLSTIAPGRYILILRSGGRLRWTWLYINQ